MSRDDQLDQVGFERYFQKTRKGKKRFVFRHIRTTQYASPHSVRRASTRLGMSEEWLKKKMPEALEKGKQWFQIEDEKISSKLREDVHSGSRRLLLYYEGIVWVFGKKRGGKSKGRDLITLWRLNDGDH